MIRGTFDFAAGAINGALGDDVTYEGVPIKAVYGAEFAAVLSGNLRMSSQRAEISVRLSDLAAAPAPDDSVTVRGVDYTVATVKPDAENVSATLVLKRA